MTKEELVEHFKQSSALPDGWGLIDADLLRSAIFEVLPMRQEEIEDYDAFLKGKTAIAYGFTPNEKRWLKRHVEAHGGKFRVSSLAASRVRGTSRCMKAGSNSSML